jgi:uncharacterized protein YecE (DUF72 family)
VLSALRSRLTISSACGVGATELAEWAPKVSALARDVGTTYVLFND